jgi:hypothetical protein
MSEQLHTALTSLGATPSAITANHDVLNAVWFMIFIHEAFILSGQCSRVMEGQHGLFAV